MPCDEPSSLKTTPSSPVLTQTPDKLKKSDSEKDEVKKVLFASPHTIDQSKAAVTAYVPCETNQNLGDIYDGHLNDVVMLLLESEGIFSKREKIGSLLQEWIRTNGALSYWNYRGRSRLMSLRG